MYTNISLSKRESRSLVFEDGGVLYLAVQGTPSPCGYSLFKRESCFLLLLLKRLIFVHIFLFNSVMLYV
jgi:hypothetical protein